MPLDQAAVGQVVTGQMEAIEHDHGDDDDVEIGAVISIVEVVKKAKEGQITSAVRMRSNVADPFRAIGLMRTAEQNLTARFDRR